MVNWVSRKVGPGVVAYRQKQGDKDVDQRDTKNAQIEPDACAENQKQISNRPEDFPHSPVLLTVHINCI